MLRRPCRAENALVPVVPGLPAGPVGVASGATFGVAARPTIRGAKILSASSWVCEAAGRSSSTSACVPFITASNSSVSGKNSASEDSRATFCGVGPPSTRRRPGGVAGEAANGSCCASNCCAPCCSACAAKLYPERSQASKSAAASRAGSAWGEGAAGAACVGPAPPYCASQRRTRRWCPHRRCRCRWPVAVGPSALGADHSVWSSA